MLQISSIKRFLLIAIISLISIVWSISALLNFHESQEQVEELFDAELAQMTRILQAVMVANIKFSASGLPKSIDYLDKKILGDAFGHQDYNELGHKYEKKLAFQVWDRAGKLFFENHIDLPKSFDLLQRGYQTLPSDEVFWRSFTLEDEDYGFWVKVSQREDVRTELTNEIAWNTTWPNLVVVPFLLIILGWVINRGLLPLKTISNELKGRGYQNLTGLNEADYPTELKHMVFELNGLFQRVSAASERERRFTADAAHELRTPLAISKVHLQNILQISKSSQVIEFVQKALSGIERLIHMVQQLLILSRLDAQQEGEGLALVDVRRLCDELVTEVSQTNELASRGIQLTGENKPNWVANETQLRILVRNLLDNACRYSELGSSVEIEFDDGVLLIRNGCQNLAPEELTHILERFKRGKTNQQGSGLGLSICQQICQQNGYELKIANRQGDIEGVEVSVFNRSEKQSQTS
jgi:two-component system sensor histidine kinase QseC